MPHRQRLAIEGVAIGKAVNVLPIKELLNAVAERGLSHIFLPPRIVDRPIADASPRVVSERRRRSIVMHNLCTVEVVVIGSKPGLRPSDLAEHIPAHIGGFGPELAVLRRSPARPQFIERRQMIGSVRDRKSTRLNSSHGYISYAVFCLKKKKKHHNIT